MNIEADRFYSPCAPELNTVAAKQTLAKWRSAGKGPAYIKSGSRVLYKGADVLEWLQERRVQPNAS
ncbi:helix-turn-helix transcriptional regulator [Cognatishimia activa]|uniref:Helix-turn-helix domain-containing protein n=1 Tax=Cognatishimia activa TaxID=1715691 RepID=A0A975I673_9RHOB|nr:helix-turn-helix domain-containing protein [Cognatishimia activa]